MEGLSMRTITPLVVIVVVIATRSTHAISTDQLSENTNVTVLREHIAVASPLQSENGKNKMAAELTMSSESGDNTASDLNARGKFVVERKSIGNESEIHGFKAKRQQLLTRIKRSLPTMVAARGAGIAHEDRASDASEDDVFSPLDQGTGASLIERDGVETLYPRESAFKDSYLQEDPRAEAPLLDGGTSEMLRPTRGAIDQLMKMDGPFQEALGLEARAPLLDRNESEKIYLTDGTANWLCSTTDSSTDCLSASDPETVAPQPARDSSDSEWLRYMLSSNHNEVPQGVAAVASQHQKRNRVMDSFLGMRGKKDLSEETSPLDDMGHSLMPKRNRVFEGFLGMRGKKAAGGSNFVRGFLGMRGKKELQQPKRSPLAEAFYGMRGKKDDGKQDHDIADEGIFTPGGGKWKYGEQDGDWLATSKRIPEGFLGMRGKRRVGNENVQPEMYAAMMRKLGVRGLWDRMRDGGATYPNILAGRSLMARSRAVANDRKRQIGSIFVGMRG